MPQSEATWFLRKFSRSASAGVIVIGCMVILGWILDVTFLKSVFSGFVPMNPLSALLFIAGGAGVRQTVGRTLRPRRNTWIFVMGGLVAFGGLLKLAEHQFGFALNFDQLWFARKLGQSASLPAGEIAPNSAVNFCLCGAGLLLLDAETRRGWRPAQACFLGALFIALLALIGYCYRVFSLYSIDARTPMALNTAVTFLLLCLAGIAARPDRGMMMVVTSNTTGGAMARRLLPAAILIPLILGGVRLIGERSGYYRTEFGVLLFAISNMLIFTGLIWWNAKLLFLADRQRARVERRIVLQYSSTRVLAESPTLADATPKILRTICETLGWQVGVMWSVGEPKDVLRCVEVWRSPAAGATEFLEATRRMTFGRGMGLPGRVWESGQPAWIADVAQDRGFSRGSLAAEANLHSALGFPIRLGSEILGVMEFFGPDIEQPDQTLLAMLSAIGSQIGLFIDRKRAEEQLRRASSELSRSNADLQQFAYAASHDLSEPLRMVISYLQLLKEQAGGKLNGEEKEFIAFAVDGAQRMRALITDLLAYARVGHSNRPLERTDLEDVAEAAIANLKVAIGESGAVIEHDPLPTVQADPVQLGQLFQNLISNAIKFHGEAKPRIHIGADKKNGEWMFHVRDNGIGIDPKNFDRIFTLFQRLHTRQEYPGTGMGLSICKKIVERHGGRIWVESTPGQGTTFFFTLPVRNMGNGH